MFVPTRSRILDAANRAVNIATPIARVAAGGQRYALLVGTGDDWHFFDGSMAQIEADVGWSPPISVSSIPGNIDILSYTLPIGAVCSGLRGLDDPPPGALHGRLIVVTLKGASGYGHEVSLLFFLGSPFESFGDLMLDSVASTALAVPGVGGCAGLFAQTRYVAAVAGGIVETSVSVSAGVALGWLSYEGRVTRAPGATGAPSTMEIQPR